PSAIPRSTIVAAPSTHTVPGVGPGNATPPPSSPAGSGRAGSPSGTTYPGTWSMDRTTARSGPTTNDTGAPLSSGATAVRVIRPRASSIRTTSSAPRPNSSQPAVTPSSEWPSVITAIGVAGGLVGNVDGTAVGSGART